MRALRVCFVCFVCVCFEFLFCVFFLCVDACFACALRVLYGCLCVLLRLVCFAFVYCVHALFVCALGVLYGSVLFVFFVSVHA